jgi:hypothetical protein
MSRAYCAYFDHRYLVKGLAMIRSLRRHVPDAQIWVLCLDQRAHDMMREISEPGVHAIALSDFEAGDVELARAKADGRSTVEYIFTLTPSLIRHVMCAAPDAEIVTYLDSDLWFLTDPEPVYREMGNASVLIIPHGFAPSMKHLERYGIYNVGWVSLRRDAQGEACVEWWRERTNEWCLDHVEGDRFADQGYLNEFPRLFAGVHVLSHLGANLAPWNVAARTISSRDGAIYANDDRVLFFHFHGLRRLDSGGYLTSHGFYKAPLVPLVRDHLYRSYLREVSAIEREVESRFGPIERSPVRELRGKRKTWAVGLRNAKNMMLNHLRGYVITPD